MAHRVLRAKDPRASVNIDWYTKPNFTKKMVFVQTQRGEEVLTVELSQEVFDDFIRDYTAANGYVFSTDPYYGQEI